MEKPDTATLQAWDKRYIWHPFTQMRDWEAENPIVITRGEGVYLFDTDGNRYLDGVASIWTNVHGHCRPEINEAVKAQIDRLEHSTLLGMANDTSILLAKRLVEIAPAGLCKVFYSDNGSTAVEVGIKMAFQYWRHLGQAKKTKFMTFRHAYHGDTIGSVSVGGIDLFHGVFRPLLFETLQAPSPSCYHCEAGCADIDSCGLHCLRELERLMAAHSDELAGLVIEPLLQGAGGMIVQPAGFVRRVRELCDNYDVLMIADEVATGFGRTGTMFACDHESVTPDIMALSKGITAGYMPLAVTMATQKIYDAYLGAYSELKTFFHGHTFTGNPLACAAALASLDLFEADSVLERMQPKIGYMAERLAKLAQLDHVGDIRHIGLAAGIELVADKDLRTSYPWEERMGVKVCLEARRHGLFLRPLGNVVVIFPPLAISLEEMATLMDGVEASIKSATA